MVKFIKRFLGVYQNPDPVLAGHYPFLVTGCARSGTHFITSFLKANGLEMGHEATGKMGAVAWLCASEKYCNERKAVFEKTLHLIRHPAKAMASFQTMNARAWDYIFEYSPACAHEDKLVASAKYWIEWNRLAKEKSVKTIKLEDFETAPDEVCALLGEFFNIPVSKEALSSSGLVRDSRAGSEKYGGNEIELLKKKYPQNFDELVIAAREYNYHL